MAQPNNLAIAVPMVEIYALLDPRNKAVRYIGKANNAQKRLKTHLSDCLKRKSPVCLWVKELLDAGMKPTLEILCQCSETTWPATERAAIAMARKAVPDLLNLADGGNQPKCSPEQCAANGRKGWKTRVERWRKYLTDEELKMLGVSRHD